MSPGPRMTAIREGQLTQWRCPDNEDCEIAVKDAMDYALALRAERDQAIQGERDRACERDALKAGVVSMNHDHLEIEMDLARQLEAMRAERDRAAKWNYEPAWKSAEVRVAALSAQLEDARAALRKISEMSCMEHDDDEHEEGCGVTIARAALSISTPVKPPAEDLKEKQP